MTRLREFMTREMELKGYSRSTMKAYINGVGRFARHFGKSPEHLGEEEIRSYLHLLTVERRRSQSYLNQVYSGLRFLYEHCLGRDWGRWRIPRAKKATKLPTVLSRTEVRRLLGTVRNVKHRAILTTIYSAGLRVGEAVHLRPEDIDSERMVIRVMQGKGRKDRETILAHETLLMLRAYYRAYHPSHWLFPGQDPEKPLHIRSVQKVFERARLAAEIEKPATVHTLRHSFATHLLDDGVDLFHIQRLLGHANTRTTTVYLHVTTRDLARIRSTFDTPQEDLQPTS